MPPLPDPLLHRMEEREMSGAPARFGHRKVSRRLRHFMVGLSAMSPDAPPLLTSLLEQVSRSFYKTLWVLPRSVRQQISLAYLLARITDTIADTELLPLEQRLNALRQFRDRLAGTRHEPLEFTALARAQGAPAERLLLERSDEAAQLLDQFPEPDRKM